MRPPTKLSVYLREFVENSRHPETPARGLGGSELRLLTPFPQDPGNPGMNSKPVVFIEFFCI